jgi:hypothetical protein
MLRGSYKSLTFEWLVCHRRQLFFARVAIDSDTSVASCAIPHQFVLGFHTGIANLRRVDPANLTAELMSSIRKDLDYISYVLAHIGDRDSILHLFDEHLCDVVFRALARTMCRFSYRSGMDVTGQSVVHRSPH